ncbi:glutamine--tRNA ligase, partial [Stenotrophomonas maltophilia]
ALGDSIEGITHSLCTLEFEDHRPLYDWCVDNVDFAHDDALTQPLVRWVIRSRASPTRCARWNSKTTARCTTGAWTTS